MKTASYACLLLCLVAAALTPSSLSAQSAPTGLVKELVATWQRASFVRGHDKSTLPQLENKASEYLMQMNKLLRTKVSKRDVVLIIPVGLRG